MSPTPSAPSRRARTAVAVTLLVATAAGLAGTATGETGPTPAEGVATVPTTSPATAAAPTTVPATTLPPSTSVPPAAVTRPVLSLRRAPRGPWVGTGPARPGSPPTIESTARAGQRIRFVIRVRHDGSAATTLRIQASVPPRGALGRWRLGGRDVTLAVRRGELALHLVPGQHRDLTLDVALGPAVAKGAERVWTVTARTDDGRTDRVRATVIRIPRPLALHDVGPALGLPLSTHTFDLDAARIDGDAFDDLVVSYHGRVEVLLNRRPGFETAVVVDRGDLHACAVGRANADARADVYCTRGASNGNTRGNNLLLIQQPDGSFENQVVGFGVVDRWGRGRHPTFLDLDRRDGPDLFVGNEFPRNDGHRSLNRTFLNTGGAGFEEARLGIVRNSGALCAQPFDQDGDGWEDLLVCGGGGLATPGWDERENWLHLYRNERRGGGPGRRLVDVAPRLGVRVNRVQSATLAHLNEDRFADLVVVTRVGVRIWPGVDGGRFGRPVLDRRLNTGRWVAVADVDGANGLDVFVVQSCNERRHNGEDRLYLSTGPGWTWSQADLPEDIRGCGDVATALDVDGDGIDDLVVGNGHWAAEGPLQVLTAGNFGR